MSDDAPFRPLAKIEKLCLKAGGKGPIWVYQRARAKGGGNSGPQGKAKRTRTPNRRPYEPRGKVIWNPRDPFVRKMRGDPNAEE
jgi:hypothetical protein